MANMNHMASSSPHSSNGATQHETPSTNFTAFSPETVGTVNSSAGVQPKFNLRVTTDGLNTTDAVSATRSGDDVFLNEPASTLAMSQLSPVADSFTPGQYLTSSTTTATGDSASHRAGIHNEFPGDEARWRTIGYNPPVRNLLQGSTPDGVPGIFDFINEPLYANALPANIPMRPLPDLLAEFNQTINRMNELAVAAAPRAPLLRTIDVAEGTFSTDEQRGRAVLISGIPTDFSELTIRTIFNQQQWNSILGVSFRDLKQHGVVVVGFSDIRDAAQIQPYIKNVQPSWNVRRISPKQYAQQTTGLHCDVVSDHEAQLLLTVFYDGNQNLFLAGPVITALKQTLATYGYLKAFYTLPAGQQHARDFRIEFEDTRSAHSALTTLHEVNFENFVTTVERYQPDIRTQLPPSLGPPTTRQVLSVTGRSTIPIPSDSDFQGEEYYNRYRYNSPARGARDRYDVNGNHNQVIIPKIEVGLDVRTTIMLRNIPNKIDSAMLKEILDETSHGAYDFMYLRIDFANNCNVGYAFINFVDALAIIPFAVARAGQRWNKFSSDKVAEISYATIQGKDCLVQKFRNSSVMLEHPTFRPKLFTTGSGPGAGEEEPFPGPDNVSKMRRSVENAEHVGLFAPRQGQAYREEQRRRRSQFDRGTPGAEYEAYTNRLTDPALSPVHTTYNLRLTGHDNNNNIGGFGPAYGSGMSTPRPGYGYY